MIRKLVTVICLSALTATTAMAQGAAPKSGAALDAAKKTWVGLWEGPVWHMGENDPIGGYRLEIALDSTWKLSIDVITGQTTSGRGSNFVPDGNNATWLSALMGQSCNTKATIDGHVLKGETRCGEHGGLAFELKKKE